MTEQTGHALDTEIVEVFPPVAEDNTEYNIESYSALKIFDDVIKPSWTPMLFYGWVLSPPTYKINKTLNIPTKL